METHVKVLGALNVVCGLMGLFGALVLFLIFGSAATAVGANADSEAAAIALPFIGITGVALVAFLVVVSLPELVIGIGLFRIRQWARVGGIVVALISLLAFPFGTLLGVYGLWVLFSKDTERLFADRRAIA